MTEEYKEDLLKDGIISELLDRSFEQLLQNHHLYLRLKNDNQLSEKPPYNRSYINNNYANPVGVVDYYDSYRKQLQRWENDFRLLILELKTFKDDRRTN